MKLPEKVTLTINKGEEGTDYTEIELDLLDITNNEYVYEKDVGDIEYTVIINVEEE